MRTCREIERIRAELAWLNKNLTQTSAAADTDTFAAARKPGHKLAPARVWLLRSSDVPVGISL
jgi:hypothetical protein